MKRTAAGYTPRYRVVWTIKGNATRPAVAGWTGEVAKRMRARGHKVIVQRQNHKLDWSNT